VADPYDGFPKKAEENLEAAQSELVNRRYNSFANRCYYDCFQAAIYALAREGIGPRGAPDQWSHAFVQAEFNGQLINRRKLYSAALGTTLERTYALRETADYTTDDVTEVRAGRVVARAEEFLQAIKRAAEDKR
jgi:uncharacterized protein (UPF0332 family)